MEGHCNLRRVNAYGIHLRCRPRDDLKSEIQEIIESEDSTFPYEYYQVEIKGFGGGTITPYRQHIKHINIDNTKISNDLASKAYVKTVYSANTSEVEKNELKYGYRTVKDQFSEDNLKCVNQRIDEEYSFVIQNNVKANLETDLTISKRGIDIENLGVGSQCFIRTSFALSKKTNIEVVLLEEPENHLSHTRMNELISEVKKATSSQVFIATHSSLVCSRLDLRSAILFGELGVEPKRLTDLKEDTAEYYMKAPNNSLLEFVLSDRNILVEGDAEYILMSSLYNNVMGNRLEGSGLHVISVGGLSFPRYLDLAKLIGVKTAVITDNDGSILSNCERKYAAYRGDDNIKIFFDEDESRRTFEICIYRDNSELCESLFAVGRRKLTVEQFMLANKSTVAFELAQQELDEVVAPKYIDEAIRWIMN
ncbi:TOPRIM nucleotidyl transferase/hydrolase domain-containing protein [Pseudovibrio sp. POLY-S9]|uniref:ATP-dependent nuclease n=1 Tax=Pseudovibrio sp. POLY-S9 TaxID=1576596 RepID=UPI00070E7E66|nr:TOPRIM nucleotidyl transferase/hydrolase domain-containing protein [Pseudovibrio sp. POLY-S9]